jgi:hypothetical protein
MRRDANGKGATQGATAIRNTAPRRRLRLAAMNPSRGKLVSAAGFPLTLAAVTVIAGKSFGTAATAFVLILAAIVVFNLLRLVVHSVASPKLRGRDRRSTPKLGDLGVKMDNGCRRFLLA